MRPAGRRPADRTNRKQNEEAQAVTGPVRDLNPGPLAPEARIIPLDQRAAQHAHMPPPALAFLPARSRLGRRAIPLKAEAGGDVPAGSVAEWSKALVLGTSLCGGVGSNPTAVIIFKFSSSGNGKEWKRSHMV